MSNNEHTDRMGGILLVILGVGVAAGFVIYLISSMWIYLWFYLVPFLVASVVGGLILKAATSFMVERSESDAGSSHYLIYNYKALAVAYPFLIVIVSVCFFANSTYRVELNKKREVLGGVLEWPKLNQFFNETKKSWYTDSWYKSLRDQANVPEVFDRRDLGGSIFFALFLGVPAVFYFLSRKDEEKQSDVIREKIKSKVRREEERLRDLIAGQKKIIEKEIAAARVQADKMTSENIKLEQENLALRAKIEFVVPKAMSSALLLPPITEEKHAVGILDADIL